MFKRLQNFYDSHFGFLTRYFLSFVIVLFGFLDVWYMLLGESYFASYP